MAHRLSKGLTVLELAVAMTVMGILAAVSIPSYMSFMRNVRAAQAVADVQAIRAAVYMYFGDRQSWPAEEQAGVVPPSLTPYLPRDVVFYKSSYRLDWDNWITTVDNGDGTSKIQSKFPKTGVLAGVSVVSNDKEFLEAVRGLLAHAPLVNVSPSRTTLIVAGEKGF